MIRGHCFHCGQRITATTPDEWRRKVRRPCPYCGGIAETRRDTTHQQASRTIQSPTTPDTKRQEAIRTAQSWLASDAVVLDTETTGFGHKARIVEIAVVDCTGRIVLDSLVNPGQPISEASSAIHGVTDQDVADARPFAQVYDELRPLIQYKRILAYNSPFDRFMIQQSAQTTIPTITRWGCIMKLYAEFRGYNQRQKLAAALEQCGLPPETPAHRAAADARAALRVLKHIASARDMDD